MNARWKKSVRWVIVLALLAVAVIVVERRYQAAVRGWGWVTPYISSGGFLSSVNGLNTPNSVNYHYSCEIKSGSGDHASTSATLSITINDGYDFHSGALVSADRDAVRADALIEIKKLLVGMGYPELVSDIPAALAAKGVPVVHVYPGRRVHDILLIALSYVVPLAWLGLVLLLYWSALLWVDWRTFRKIARRHCCQACGYDLSGLAFGAVCPECGKAAR